MTMIVFRDDKDRANFRLHMALHTLQSEVNSKLGIRFYRGNIVNVLKEWFPDLPRTRKSAYKYLVKKGFYVHEQPRIDNVEVKTQKEIGEKL